MSFFVCYYSRVSIPGALLHRKAALQVQPPSINIEEITRFVISARILILTVIVARTPLRGPAQLMARPFIWMSAMVQLRLEAATAVVTSPFRRKERSPETDRL